MGFSLPSPLGQPLRDDMFDVREPLQFILDRIAFRVGGTKAIQYSVNITSLPRRRNQYYPRLVTSEKYRRDPCSVPPMD